MCYIQPISQWAFQRIVAHLDAQDRDAAFNFYRTIQGTLDGAVMRGKMWETKVHKFFGSIMQPRTFHIFSLDGHSASFDIEFSSSTLHRNFGPTQIFGGELASSVKIGSSCYLKPESRIFATFDSFLYQHGMSQPGCQPLIGCQITDARAHPMSTKGLASVQKCLKSKIPELKSLRPTKARRWIILFVVPERMAASFVKQQFKDTKTAAHWEDKTTQYVLGLPVAEVMRS
jgi:hypothetical protein